MVTAVQLKLDNDIVFITMKNSVKPFVIQLDRRGVLSFKMIAVETGVDKYGQQFSDGRFEDIL